MTEGKTASELMEILQEKHHIDISKEKHENELLQMGYFHGFKGYRYLRKRANRIPYTHFDEVIAIYQFDMKLKALYYPQLMLIETVFKNVTLDAIISQGSANFEQVYQNVLNDYAKHEPGSTAYKSKMKRRLELRTKIYRTISYNYNSNQEIVQHYLHDNRPVPLWAIFEIMNLGDFAFFVNSLNVETRIDVAEMLNIHHQTHNARGRVLEDMLALIRDLRNAVAHNSGVFDCRYRHTKPTNRLVHYLQAEMKLENITFDTPIDYVALIAFIMKQVGMNEAEFTEFVASFQKAIKQLQASLPEVICSAILGEDYEEKLEVLRTFTTNEKD